MTEITRQIDTYHNMYVICTVLAVVFLLISALLFWRFRIIEVIGELTGKTARKKIQQLEDDNKLTGKLQKQKKEGFNNNPPVLADIVTPSGEIIAPNQGGAVQESIITEPITEEMKVKTEEEDLQTEVLTLSQEIYHFVLEKNTMIIHTEEKI